MLQRQRNHRDVPNEAAPEWELACDAIALLLRATRPTTSEPTIEELSVAWTRAISLRGIPGAGTEAIVALQQLRDRRCTWLGDYENRLRVCLDEYLGATFHD